MHPFVETTLSLAAAYGLGILVALPPLRGLDGAWSIASRWPLLIFFLITSRSE